MSNEVLKSLREEICPAPPPKKKFLYCSEPYTAIYLLLNLYYIISIVSDNG